VRHDPTDRGQTDREVWFLATAPPGQEPEIRSKRYDGTPRLYGSQEAAQYLGVSRRNLSAKVARRQMIEPVARLTSGPVWSESQLDEMAFHWRSNPPGQWSDDLVHRYTLARRLGRLERRWEQLVEATTDRTDYRRIRAVWQGEPRAKRLNRGRKSALATAAEARRALAEAKLLRLVTHLRDEDPVFAGIAAQLDEAANLREQLETLKNTRRKLAAATEALDTHLQNPTPTHT
jgi:hypothetical protein